jgi:hypothetical protein
MDTSALAEHGASLKMLASTLFSEATNQYGQSGWSKLYIDVRVPKNGHGASTTEKVLVGGHRKVFETSANVGSVILDLVRSRANVPGKPWFGCLMIVTSEGGCEVFYDYDETCIDRLVEDSRAGKPF